MARRILLCLLLANGLAGAAPAVASVDDPASARDADACQADIHRLCDRYFPDEKLVAACLVDKRANLSQACAEVLARPPDDDQD